MNRTDGPSKETILGLAGGLPSMLAGMGRGKIGGKGIKVQNQVPHNVCPLCGTAFNFKPQPIERPDDNANCEKCQSLLTDGYTAFVCEGGSHAAFAKSPRFTDWAGTVQQVSPVVLEKIRIQFVQEWEVKAQ